jgi:outer membrane protein assembly factor BamD
MKKIVLLSIAFVALCSCNKFVTIQKSDNVDLKYKAAVRYFDKKDFYHAATLFEELVPVLKGQKQAEKVQFFLAYSQYHQGQFIMSSYYFKKFANDFPRSEYAEHSFFMHCVSLYEDSPEFSLDQTNTKTAIEEFQVFVERFPNSKHIVDANEIMDELNGKLEKKAYYQAKLYYQMREYRASVTTFENVIKDFPSSRFLEEVSYLKIDAQYNFANNSTDAKKKERMEKVNDYYLNFIDRFPNSKFITEAEKIYTLAQNYLELAK